MLDQCEVKDCGNYGASVILAGQVPACLCPVHNREWGVFARASGDWQDYTKALDELAVLGLTDGRGVSTNMLRTARRKLHEAEEAMGVIANAWVIRKVNGPENGA